MIHKFIQEEFSAEMAELIEDSLTLLDIDIEQLEPVIVSEEILEQNKKITVVSSVVEGYHAWFLAHGIRVAIPVVDLKYLKGLCPWKCYTNTFYMNKSIVS